MNAPTARLPTAPCAMFASGRPRASNALGVHAGRRTMSGRSATLSIGTGFARELASSRAAISTSRTLTVSLRSHQLRRRQLRRHQLRRHQLPQKLYSMLPPTPCCKPPSMLRCKSPQPTANTMTATMVATVRPTVAATVACRLTTLRADKAGEHPAAARTVTALHSLRSTRSCHRPRWTHHGRAYIAKTSHPLGWRHRPLRHLRPQCCQCRQRCQRCPGQCRPGRCRLHLLPRCDRCRSVHPARVTTRMATAILLRCLPAPYLLVV